MDLVDVLEVLSRARRYGQLISPAARQLANDHPGWWCKLCNAGGAFLIKDHS